MNDTTQVDQRLRKAVADLETRGYHAIPSHPTRAGQLAPGARVRGYGHQWPTAIARGTGVVHAVMLRDPSRWADKYGRPDVEIVVKLDRVDWPTLGVEVWADYGTILALPLPGLGMPATTPGDAH